MNDELFGRPVNRANVNEKASLTLTSECWQHSGQGFCVLCHKASESANGEHKGLK